MRQHHEIHRLIAAACTLLLLATPGALAGVRAPEQLEAPAKRTAAKAGGKTPAQVGMRRAPERGNTRHAVRSMPTQEKAFSEGDFLLTEDPLDVNYPAMTAGEDAYFVVAEWTYEENDRDVTGFIVPLDEEAPLVSVHVDGSTADSFAPAVAYAPDLGLYLVVWEDFEGAVSNIYGAFVNRAGEKASESFIVAGTEDEEFAPAVAYTGLGDFVVLYGAAADYTLASGFLNTYATRVNMDEEGAIGLGDEMLVAEDSAFPTAARVNDELVLVAYQRLYERTEGDVFDWDWDVAARGVNWEGTPAGAPLELGNSEVPETLPAVAYAPETQQAVAAWETGRGGTDRDIEAASFSVNSDASLGDPAVYTAFDSPYFDGEPHLAWDAGNAAFLLTWQHDFEDLDGDIFTIELDADGDPIGEVQAAIQTEAEQRTPAVAALNGWFLVVWAEYIEDSFDLVARFYEADGSCAPPPAPANLEAVPDDTEGQVRLMWDTVPGAEGYHVYYEGAAGNPESGGITGTSGVLTVSGLEGGTNYCFTVTAFDACGESAPSDEACAVPANGSVGDGRTLRIPASITPDGHALEAAVLLDDASGVFSFRVAVCYPSELTFENAVTGSLNPGWSLAVNNSGGVVTVSASGTSALSGSGSIARLRFGVPDTSDGGNLTFCDTAALKLNDGQIALGTPVDGSYAAPAGFTWGDLANAPGQAPDITCDDIVGGLDAALMLRWDVGLTDVLYSCPDNTPYTYPDFPPGGDVNGDGVLGGLDASLVLRYDAGVIDCFPADTDCDGTGPGKAAIKQVGERVLSLPVAGALPGNGEVLEVPVHIDDASGVFSYRVSLRYPERALRLEETAAGGLTTDWLGPVRNNADGIVTVAGSGTESANGPGTLVTLRFTVVEDAEPVALTFENTTRLNDGNILVRTQDATMDPGAAQLVVTPATDYSFGAVMPGADVETAFTVRNTGTAAATGAATVSGTGFSVISGASYTLEPDATAQVRVRFAPQEAGDFNGMLTLTGDPDGALTVALDGTGANKGSMGCAAGTGIGDTSRGDVLVLALAAVGVIAWTRRRQVKTAAVSS
ncbi:MAG: cohesin domain-containing protein [Candidatus Hydrogenedentota bacterium]